MWLMDCHCETTHLVHALSLAHLLYLDKISNIIRMSLRALTIYMMGELGRRNGIETCHIWTHSGINCVRISCARRSPCVFIKKIIFKILKTQRTSIYNAPYKTPSAPLRFARYWWRIINNAFINLVRLDGRDQRSITTRLSGSEVPIYVVSGCHALYL